MLEEYSGDTFYHKIFVPLAVVTVALAWLARPSGADARSASFGSFQSCYLFAWCFAVAADWLQAPFVYALYSAYGFNTHQISLLFMAGFLSSMVFSTFVGSMADRWGRKKCCLVYCLVYAGTCFSKHFNMFPVLIAGRILSGIATSILWSCFECWMVSEHLHRHQFSDNQLSYMFGIKYTSMYFVAIVSGLAAQICSDAFVLEPISAGSKFYVGGYTMPFDLGILCLVVASLIISLKWDENYGYQRREDSFSPTITPQALLGTLDEGVRVLFRIGGAAGLSLVTAGFEGAMYIFVVSWTPAVASATVPPPHGLIFSSFMMACMCGASICTLTSDVEPLRQVAVCLVLGVFTFACLSYLVTRPELLELRFAALLCFEFLVGCYFPAVGILKSEIVPERVRGTVYNLYRLPLNAAVIGFLMSQSTLTTSFRLCMCFLTVALLALGSVHAAQHPESKHLLQKGLPTLESPQQNQKFSGASRVK